MLKHGGKRLGDTLAWWVSEVQRFAAWVVMLSILISGSLLYFTTKNLGISTDTEDMLSETLHFRRLNIDYKKAFPQYDNVLLIVINGDTPDLAQDAGSKLAERLKREQQVFKSIYMPGSGRFFEQNGLLYLNLKELEDLADNLAAAQTFLAKLSQDMSLKGLLRMLDNGIEAVMEGEDIDLAQVLDHVSNAFDAAFHESPYHMSWIDLMKGQDANPDGRRRFIIAQPLIDYSKLLPGGAAMDAVRRIAKELHLNPVNGIRVRLTGSVALEFEELQSVSRGAGMAGILALIMVVIVLFLGLRSPRLVLATLTTLIMGLIWTAGFATGAVGHLNMISVAFAVLYIGLGVDYAIHFCLRFKELLFQGQPQTLALQQTARDIGSSLVLCAFTTAIGFYAFIPTVFKGVAELGLISGTGMFIGLIANLTVLPALLTLMPIRRPPNMNTERSKGSRLSLLTTSQRIPRVIRIGSIVIGLGSLLLLPGVTFDHNTLNLRDPESESVATFKELLAQAKHSPWSLVVLTADAQAAKDLKERLSRLEPVDEGIASADFIPSEQKEKLALIEEISLILGPDLGGSEVLSSPSISEQFAAIQKLRSTLVKYDDRHKASPLTNHVRRLSNALDRFETDIKTREKPPKEAMIRRLEDGFLSSLPERLRLLQASLSAEKITKDLLPGELVNRWVASDGRQRVEIFPKRNLNEPEALRQFVDSVQRITQDAIGFPVILLEAGDAVVGAFRQALISSLIAIAILLFILMDRKLDALLVLLPLLLAGAMTGASSVLFNIPFNFANVIALPLILGIGVDSGIHMAHRIRTAPPDEDYILRTSTARAVLFSALTTICGFGNLALSPHRGTASMGLLLTIGIGLTLICTLIVLPALMTRRKNYNSPRQFI